MNIKPLLRLTKCCPPIRSPASFSTKSDFQKSIQVCVLGASTRLGIYSSFLMKQNPLISRLHLQGCFPIETIGMDLNFMDTRCQVQTYCGLEQSIPKAVKVSLITYFYDRNFFSDFTIDFFYPVLCGPSSSWVSR